MHLNRSYYAGRRTMHQTRAVVPQCSCETVTETNQPVCDGMVLAMSYMLNQEFTDLYEADAGFPRGTIFAQLDKPFMAGGMGCG